MTQTAPEQGIVRRVLAAIGAFLQALDYTSFDYTLDRIALLERELERVKEELRQSRDPGAAGDPNASAAASER